MRMKFSQIGVVEGPDLLSIYRDAIFSLGVVEIPYRIVCPNGLTMQVKPHDLEALEKGRPRDLSDILKTQDKRGDPKVNDLLAGWDRQKIIGGFPGVGKSHFCKMNPWAQDSDSSKFKEGWPHSYFDHIAHCPNLIVLVSIHDEVRPICDMLVYPDIACKEEYLERYRQRESPEAFIEMMDKNWEKFVTDCAKSNVNRHIVLHAGEFLSDARLF